MPRRTGRVLFWSTRFSIVVYMWTWSHVWREVVQLEDGRLLDNFHAEKLKQWASLKGYRGSVRGQLTIALGWRWRRTSWQKGMAEQSSSGRGYTKAERVWCLFFASIQGFESKLGKLIDKPLDKPCLKFTCFSIFLWAQWTSNSWRVWGTLCMEAKGVAWYELWTISWEKSS